VHLSVAHVPRFGADEAVELIEHACRVGLRTAWIADQPFYLDPYVTVAAALHRVPNFSLGIAVTNPFTSHPVLIARMAATVANVAGQARFTLALGTGNRREFLAPLGYDSKGSVERCRDALLLIRRLLAGERVSHSGAFTAEDVALSFKPTAVPIYVAGIGPRMLEMAGEHADGVIVNLASEPGLRFGAEFVARGRQRREEQLADPEIVAWAVALSVQRRELVAEAYDRVRPFVAHLFNPASRELLDCLGVPRRTSDKIKETYRADGPDKAARYVSDEIVDHWCWIGTPEDLTERFAVARSAGASEAVSVSFYCKSPQEEHELISTLGESVALALSSP
jgi:5,10-methylenetetrahydromethanopterin reductase